VRRTDAPPDGATGDSIRSTSLPYGRGSARTESEGSNSGFGVADYWDAPLAQRIEAVERAAVLLGQQGHADAALLLDAAQQARRELAAPAPVVQVAGQDTTLRYDVPRGRALMRVTGARAASWLAAALLAGNSVVLFDADPLAATVDGLRRAGLPAGALSTAQGGAEALLSAAASPDVACAVIDGGPALTRAVYARLGPTADGQRALKALVSPLDGPQPGERGFTQRFAWPRVVAIRTLRHGADLAIEAPSGSGL
jgi:hypothetical protein